MIHRLPVTRVPAPREVVIASNTAPANDPFVPSLASSLGLFILSVAVSVYGFYLEMRA